MASEVSQKFRDELLKKGVSFSIDVFKIILMSDGFQFNPVTHEKYSDVSGSELATASGYTAGGQALAGVAVTPNNTSKLVDVTWSNASWTATGGNISAVGAIIFDDTHVDDIIVGFIDHGSLQTVLDGGTYTIANIRVRAR